VQQGNKRLLNILLCGEPALEHRLLSNTEFKALLLQVTHRFLLEPMSADALSPFLASYLEKAGLSGLTIEPAAMSYFHKSCKGYPGPALAICQLLVNAKLGQTEFLTVNKDELVRLIKASVTGQALPAVNIETVTNGWLWDQLEQY